MDQDLLTYLDARFQETTEQFRQIDVRLRENAEQIRELRSENAQRFGQIEQRFEQIDQRFEQIDQRFEQIEQRFTQIEQRFTQIDQRFERLETEIRHTNVVVEALRGEIQLVAEGVANVDGKLERFRGEVAQEFNEVRSLVRLSYGQLDRRLTNLELQVGDLDKRLTHLEQAA